MNNILTIIKKELRRFFTDKRMLISFILPGLIIYILYSVMGSFMGDAFTPSEEYTYNVIIEDMPNEYKAILDNSEYEINYVESNSNIESIKQEIADKNIDLYITFEDDFSDKLASGATPNVSIYYNSSSPESTEIYTYTYTSLLTLATNISYNFLVNMDNDLSYDVATSEDISAMIITMMLPFLLLTFLFTGCVSIATESIAGEKERGTIATLLVTPTKRSHIAIGKIIALSIAALVSATCSFLGVMLSLPKLISAGGEAGITLDMYNFTTYVSIFGVILVTVILFTTLLSIVSTLAKTLKEASQWSSVLMIFIMMFGVSSLMGMGQIPNNPLVYLIPVYNSVQCMSAIFAMSFNGLNFIITILANIIYVSIGIYVLAKMFNSEKIMSSN